MKKTIIYTISAILFLTTFATAQFRIKIPKIKKSKVAGAEQSTKTKSNGKTRQMVLDDGFTFFDAEVVDELDTKLHRKVGKGWTLRSYLRLFGDFPNRSGFNVVVSKAGKVLAKTRCETVAIPNANGYSDYERKAYGDHYIYTQFDGCANKKRIVQGTGKFDVLVYFFNGDTDEETLVRKYKIDVHKATRVRGPVNKTVADVPHYYISRHSDLAASILYVRSDNAFNYFAKGKSDGGFNQLEIYFNYSPKRTTDQLPRGYMRCSVNGQFIKFPGPSPYADQVITKRMRNEVAIYTDRLATQYKRGGEYKDEVAFNQMQAILPIGWGNNRDANRVNMQDYPGNWKCDFKYDGETIRTFLWTVGDNGMPVQHAEQKSGNINLYHNSFLIETEIPTGGSEYDYRLASMPSEGFFYGQSWTSAEGKAMATKVPRKGNPFHVPSNQAK